MPQSPAAQAGRKSSRIQVRNRKRILEAALEVFSTHGYRGATLDQIAAEAGLSKPNILYYFEGKEEIHVTLLNQLLDAWLAPLRAIDPQGEPLDELMGYVHRKLEMSRDLLFSIWATTQHYADFEAQVGVLMGEVDVHTGAAAHLEALFRRLLTPGSIVENS